MRFPYAALAFALVLPFASGVAPRRADAAPQGLPTRALDIELEATDVRNVYKLLREASARKVTLDPCVGGTVDIRLKNTPLPLVYDALALKLGLFYEEDENGDVRVRCKSDAAVSQAPEGAMRVSLVESSTPLEEVLGKVAQDLKLDGVDYRASKRPNVRIAVDRVRLSNVLKVLGDETGLELALVGRRIVVRD